PGLPLQPSVRDAMEEHFGADFSNVRVHADTRAAESAEAVDARAYAVGNHIVFGAGQRAEGRLLAHELAHVLQQGEVVPGEDLVIGDPGTPAEREAAAAADALEGGRTPSIRHGAAGGVVSRQAHEGPFAALDEEEVAYPTEVARLATFLVRTKYIETVVALCPPEWRQMSEQQLTEFLTSHFSEQELRARYLDVWAERTAVKAKFRRYNVVTALVLGLLWARHDLAEGDFLSAAGKVGLSVGFTLGVNQLLYARDLSAEALMASKASRFGAWFQGAARTNRAVNFLARGMLPMLILDLPLRSGAGEYPEIPFDIITEVDLDDPTTWSPPSETALNLGFNWWYRQRPNPNYPRSIGGNMYLAKVEGSIFRLPAQVAARMWESLSRPVPSFDEARRALEDLHRQVPGPPR
ncbi:MAG: DUF4157 domain-containing protein, partial [Solirubrobacterales bacterium]